MADNEGVRKTGEAVIVSKTPCVCKTPPDMKPIPYPIIGKFDTVIKEKIDVRMTGMGVVTTGTRVTTVKGNEAGAGGGMVSSVNCGMCKSITQSTTVRANGEYIVYHSSEMWMNCAGPEGVGNTTGTVIYIKVESFVKLSPNGNIEGETSPPLEFEENETTYIKKEPFCEPAPIKLPSIEKLNKDTYTPLMPQKAEGRKWWQKALSATKNVGKQVGGFFTGAGKAAWETVEGLYNMAKVGSKLSPVGIMTDPEGVIETAGKIKDTAKAVYDNPLAVWDAVKEPYTTAWQQGNYGEAIGRGTFEAVSAVLGTKGLDKIAKGAKSVDTVADVAKAADKLADTAKAADKLADTAKAADKTADAAEVGKKGVKVASKKSKKIERLKKNKKQGKIREAEVKKELIDEGHDVLGSEVTVKTPKTNRRIDHLIKDAKTGEIRAIEVKSGKAVRTASQIAKDNAMAKSGATIIGKNAPPGLRGQKLRILTEVRK